MKEKQFHMSYLGSIADKSAICMEGNMKSLEEATPKTSVISAVYTKEQLIGADRFSRHKDLLQALLEEQKQYTIKEAEQMIQKFLKGKVN